MPHKLLLLLGVILLAPAAVAAAGDEGWYLTPKLGSAALDARLGPSATFDDEDSAWGVEGGYKLNRFVAVQGGYRDLGSHRTTGSPCFRPNVGCIAVLLPPIRLTAEVDGVSLAALPTWPVHSRVDVYGKLGVIDWTAEVIPESGSPASISDTVALYGAGVRLVGGRGLSGLLEFERFAVDAEGGDGDVESLTAGLSWRF